MAMLLVVVCRPRLLKVSCRFLWDSPLEQRHRQDIVAEHLWFYFCLAFHLVEELFREFYGWLRLSSHQVKQHQPTQYLKELGRVAHLPTQLACARVDLF